MLQGGKMAVTGRLPVPANSLIRLPQPLLRWSLMSTDTAVLIIGITAIVIVVVMVVRRLMGKPMMNRI